MIKHPARTINMIYLIVLTFNWEPYVIIKLKQLLKVKWMHFKKKLKKKKLKRPNLKKKKKIHK